MSTARMDAGTPISGSGGPGLPGARLGDFWSWAYSDLLARDVRHALAQFVVAYSLDTLHVPRVDWAGPSLPYRSRSLRVHFAGHVDSWDVHAPTSAERTHEPSKAWGLDKDVVELPDDGAADCYVICHYPEKDPELAQPLDVAAWEFFVLSHFVFHRELDPEGRLDLDRLRFTCKPVGQRELQSRVHQVLGITS